MIEIDYAANEDIYNQAIRLSNSAQKDPYIFLCYFFDMHDLSSVRKLLFQWYEAAIAAENTAFDYPVGQTNLLVLYQSMESLAEAAYLLKEKKKKKLKKSKK